MEEMPVKKDTQLDHSMIDLLFRRQKVTAALLKHTVVLLDMCFK